MNWDEVHKAREGAKYPDTELVRFMAKNYYKEETRNYLKILEIGCGAGANLHYLLSEEFRAFGIDSSKVALDVAEEFIGIFTGDSRDELLFEGDILKTLKTLPKSGTDVVIDIEAVYCNMYAAAEEIYSQCHRVLKKGGRLFVKTFAAGTTESLLDDTYIRLSTKDEIQSLLKQFTIESIELHTRTKNGGIIKEWVVEAIK